MARTNRPLASAVDGDAAQLLVAAGHLAGVYLSGYTDGAAAAALRNLFPEAAYLSVSMFVGGKLLVTEFNVLQPGFVSVAFDDAKLSAAGQAMAAGVCVQAGKAEARPDFARAAASGACDCLIAAPIAPRPPRRASAETERPPPRLAPRRSSESERGAFALLKERLPLGGLTLGTQSCSPLLSLHRLRLTALGECLVPLLGSYGYPGAGHGLESLFRQSDGDAAFEAAHDSDASERASWDAALSVEDYVDSLVCRQQQGGHSCGREPDAALAVVPQLPPGLAKEPALA